MTICPACSYDYKPKAKKPRSVPQHKRFFGMVRAAYDNWPECHEFKPHCPEELRKWLTAKAGFVDRTIIHPPDALADSDERVKRLAMVWMRQSLELATAGHEYRWIRQHGDALVVFVPKSIAYDQMGPQEFGLLNDEVSKVIGQEVGIEGDELLNRSKEVA